MIDSRLTKFLDLSKHFLEVSSIDECIIEFQNTQNYIGELIKIKAEIDSEYRAIQRERDIFLADKNDAALYNFRRNGISPSEKNIQDFVIKSNKKEYERLQEQFDEKYINSEAAKSFLMSMFQRKDVICETISFMKSKKENDNCLAKNKEFLRKLGVLVDGITTRVQK